MQAHPTHVRVEIDGGGEQRAPVSGPGTVAVGPVEVGVDDEEPGTTSWWVANRGDEPLRVRSVGLVFAVDGARPPLRMFRHGYQSWSPSGVATFGVDTDPSTVADVEFLQAVHHADQRTVTCLDELRSEWVTVLEDADRAPWLVGFAGGRRHDGTLRLRRTADGDAELVAEAFLGGAELAAGARRRLHPVIVAHGGTAHDLLVAWASRVARSDEARVDLPYQVGWCSWYQYFSGVTEHAVRAELARADDWPFDVFQVDDGYQASIGDWLDTGPSFPSGLPALAESIVASGRTAGLWLAPFLVAPDSVLARERPHLVARTADGRHPLRAWWNPDWQGGDGGFLHALDTSDPEVLDHLEALAATLAGLGFRYLKLDFTFAPSVEGRWHDRTLTPAERVRAGFDAIRRGAGDDVVLLGCGVPLAHVVGVVDACRIGQDVAPRWDLSPGDEIVPGYLGIQPATLHAYGNTVARSFLHRRLWANDPDCLMLRATDTALSPAAARTWAHAVGLSGGLAVVSDDLGLLDAGSRRLLDEVVALGRASDDEARAGRPARAVDLMDHPVPTVIEAAGRRLEVAPGDGTSTLGAVT